MYQYIIVPFQGQLKSGQGVQDVSTQLQSLVNHYASQGWEFCELGSVNIAVAPGCLSGLLGTRVTYVRHDQVVFRKQVDA
jgi:hypothetical protein